MAISKSPHFSTHSHTLSLKPHIHFQSNPSFIRLCLFSSFSQKKKTKTLALSTPPLCPYSASCALSRRDASGSSRPEPTDRRLSSSTTTAKRRAPRTRERHVNLGWPSPKVGGGSQREGCSGSSWGTVESSDTCTARGSRSFSKFLTFPWAAWSAKSSTLALLSTNRSAQVSPIFLEMGVLRLCLDGSWIMCFFGKFNVVLSLIWGYRWWWLLYKTLFFFAKSNGI